LQWQHLGWIWPSYSIHAQLNLYSAQISDESHNMVAHWHCPFTIIKDDKLVDIFKDLNNKVEVPSHFTVSHNVKEIFEMSRKQVAAILKVRRLIP
jgi:hypothetical protein